MILLGHNGAGKSTLISYMLGFYPSVSSHPYLKNLSKNLPPLDLSSVGYAPEAAHLDGGLCADDYFRLLAANKKIRDFDSKKEMLSVGLTANPKQKIKSYSKGMKQRLLLSLALFGSPKTVILDEPTSGLDPFGKEEIEQFLLSKKGQSRFIISTHSLEFAYAFGDEIWILREGEIVYRDTPQSLEELREQFFKNRPEAAA